MAPPNTDTCLFNKQKQTQINRCQQWAFWYPGKNCTIFAILFILFESFHRENRIEKFETAQKKTAAKIVVKHMLNSRVATVSALRTSTI